MRLWLLRVVDENSPPFNTYQVTLGFVVRAESEQEARRFCCRDESEPHSRAWLDPKLTRCAELTTDGEAGIVIEDYLGRP